MNAELEAADDISDIKVDSVGDFTFPERNKYDAGFGLSEKTVDYICDVKGDPEWIRDFRKKALKVFNEKPMPTHWASKDLDAIVFYDNPVLSLDRALTTFLSVAPRGREQWRAQAGARLSAGVGFDGRFAAVVTVGNELVVMERGTRRWSLRLKMYATKM